MSIYAYGYYMYRGINHEFRQLPQKNVNLRSFFSSMFDVLKFNNSLCNKIKCPFPFHI